MCDIIDLQLVCGWLMSLKGEIVMRIRPLMIAMLLGIVFLVGCRGNDDLLDPGNPVSVVIWHFYQGSQQLAFDRAVSEFNNTVGLERGIIVSAHNRGAVNELAANVISSALGELDASPNCAWFGCYLYWHHSAGGKCNL